MKHDLDLEQAIDARVDDMLEAIKPHMSTLTPQLSAWCRMYLSLPFEILPNLMEEQRLWEQNPDRMRAETLYTSLHKIALAESEMGTVYPDSQLVKKIQNDLACEIDEMIREREKDFGNTLN